MYVRERTNIDAHIHTYYLYSARNRLYMWMLLYLYLCVGILKLNYKNNDGHNPSRKRIIILDRISLFIVLLATQLYWIVLCWAVQCSAVLYGGLSESVYAEFKKFAWLDWLCLLEGLSIHFYKERLCVCTCLLLIAVICITCRNATSPSPSLPHELISRCAPLLRIFESKKPKSTQPLSHRYFLVGDIFLFLFVGLFFYSA